MERNQEVIQNRLLELKDVLLSNSRKDLTNPSASTKHIQSQVTFLLNVTKSPTRSRLNESPHVSRRISRKTSVGRILKTEES